MTTSLRTTSAALFLLILIGGCASTSGEDDYDEMADAEPVKASSGPTQATASTQNPNAIKCQSIRPTGSRIPKRICLTQQEWDEQRKEAQEMSNASKNVFPVGPE